MRKVVSLPDKFNYHKIFTCLQNYKFIMYLHSYIHGMLSIVIMKVSNPIMMEYQVYC